MAKIRIAQNPTFRALVHIPVVGCEPEAIENLKAKEMREGFGEGTTLSDVVAAETEYQVQQIKDLVAGWGFDDKFDDKSILALVKSCQGTAEAVVNAYQSAFNQARLGN
ncbi:phage tail assembly chaperone [Pseudomonas sp. VD-NE white]|uniref:phage tail assembly chaperone n=1 Tax=Pseudomonas sp. VD-NE white TaxID=3075582 RepID=UPI0028929934|nr:phage tail assembly chaperone [Pseudomonas sp. VD-NE white]